jgi:polar amino acid transport system substrate-binding protein
MYRKFHVVLATTLVALLATACAAAPTSTPTGATPTATTAATGGGTPSLAASGSVAPSASVVATIPSDLLEFPGKLVICSDLPYPPQEYFDDSGNPIGSDIEIGEGIAARLGLTAQVENSVFDTIIPALTGGKCDIIISAQNINPERLGQVDMIPFFQAGQAFMVQAGNPANIQAAEDLCGKKIAVEAGTTMLDYLSGTGTFASGGSLPATCTTASKPAPEPQPFPKDSDAVAALQAGTVDAYMADLPVVIGYATDQPGQFMLAPVPQIEPALEGISVAKPADTTTQHTPIYDAVKAALISMINDGTYLNILTKYQVQGGAITVDVVNGPLPSPAPSPSAT